MEVFLSGFLPSRVPFAISCFPSEWKRFHFRKASSEGRIQPLNLPYYWIKGLRLLRMRSVIPFSMVCSFQLSIKVDQLLNDGRREGCRGYHGTKDAKGDKKKDTRQPHFNWWVKEMKRITLFFFLSPSGEQRDLVLVIWPFSHWEQTPPCNICDVFLIALVLP